MMAERAGICLVHLVWAPLGPEPLARFADSYRRHAAGVDHRLLIAMKGFAPDADRGPWLRALGETPHERLDVPADTLDLGTYRALGQHEGDARYLCFTNSSSIVLGDGHTVAERMGDLRTTLSAQRDLLDQRRATAGDMGPQSENTEATLGLLRFVA